MSSIRADANDIFTGTPVAVSASTDTESAVLYWPGETLTLRRSGRKITLRHGINVCPVEPSAWLKARYAINGLTHLTGDRDQIEKQHAAAMALYEQNKPLGGQGPQRPATTGPASPGAPVEAGIDSAEESA